jgi:hypothetical protein
MQKVTRSFPRIRCEILWLCALVVELIFRKQPIETLPEIKEDAEDWSKGSKRPVTISGSSVMVNSRKDKDRDGRKANLGASLHGPSARLLIHDDAGVGQDLRPQRSHMTTSTTTSTTLTSGPSRSSLAASSTPSTVVSKSSTTSSTMFLKPAGVDAPPTGTSKRHREVPADGKEKKKKKKVKTTD